MCLPVNESIYLFRSVFHTLPLPSLFVKIFQSLLSNPFGVWALILLLICVFFVQDSRLKIRVVTHTTQHSKIVIKGKCSPKAMCRLFSVFVIIQFHVLLDSTHFKKERYFSLCILYFVSVVFGFFFRLVTYAISCLATLGILSL